MRTITLPVQGLNFATCARSIEKRLDALAPITRVNASYVSQTVTITYDETRLSEHALRACVQDCGFGCGEPLAAADLLAATAEAERAALPAETHDGMQPHGQHATHSAAVAPTESGHDTPVMPAHTAHAEEGEHAPAEAHPMHQDVVAEQAEPVGHIEHAGHAGLVQTTTAPASTARGEMAGMAGMPGM